MKYASFLVFISTSVLGQSYFSNFETLGVDQGLSQSSIFSTMQDRQGFLWIGTGDGLNRYDGNQIRTFKAPFSLTDPSNSNLIRGNLAEDKSGNIWYSTENGLYELQRSTYTVIKKYHFSRKQLLGSDFKLCFIDKNQVLWLFSTANGFASYDTQSGVYQWALHHLKINTFQLTGSLQYDPDFDENIWFVLQRNDGLYKFNTRTRQYSHYFDGEDLLFYKAVPKGYLKVASDRIMWYDSSSQITKTISLPGDNQNFIRSVAIDRLGRWWIASYGSGLWMHDPKMNLTGKVHSKPDNVTTLLVDNKQNLWMGTDGSGMQKLNLLPPMFYTIDRKLAEAFDDDFFVKTIFEDAQKRIWFTTSKGFNYSYDRTSGKLSINPILDRYKLKDVSSICKDDHNRIWIGSESEITVSDSSGANPAKVYIPLLPQYPKSHPRVNSLRFLRQNGMVAATTQGLFLLSVQGRLIHSTLIENGYMPVDVMETPDGSIWMGTNNYGLLHIQKNNAGFLIKEKYFEGLDIKSLHADPSDAQLLWLASDKGLVQFNRVTKKSNFFSEKDGMSNSYVYSVLEDAHGYLWCSTNGGLSRFDKKNKRFTNYIAKDGLQSNEFNSGAFHQGSSGLLYFGGIKGVTWFNPLDFDRTLPTPSVSITELFVGEKRTSDSLLRTKKLSMPYFDNDLQVRFSVFDFSKPESNKVEYQLIGWDKKPLTTYSLLVTYNNLPPGDYHLKFRGSNSNSSWSDQFSLEIIIDPPYWQRWWFYSILVAVIISFIASVTWFISRQRYKEKIAELEKINALEQERKRIGMEMHDDIGANLTRIALISESAKHKPEKENSLEQIAQTSRKIVQSMSEIIWSLNPENKTFEQLMSYVHDQLHTLLESSGINYRIDLPTQGDVLMGSPMKRNIILLVKESVNNAMKHSGATEISITGKINHELLEVEVIDNGVGFDPESKGVGNGLKNMKVRCAEIKGRLQFISGHKGTTVKIQIPIDNGQSYH